MVMAQNTPPASTPPAPRFAPLGNPPVKKPKEDRQQLKEDIRFWPKEISTTAAQNAEILVYNRIVVTCSLSQEEFEDISRTFWVFAINHYQHATVAFHSFFRNKKNSSIWCDFRDILCTSKHILRRFPLSFAHVAH